MTKAEFVVKVKEALNLSSNKAAGEVVDKFTEVLIDTAKAGEEITLGGFGKFAVIERAARKCRNPQTGEVIEVPAKKAVKFKPANALKKTINE